MKKRKKQFKVKFICFLLATTLLSGFLYYSSNKILENLAMRSFDSIISSASYYAIEKVLEDGYDYKSLIDVTKDLSGNINMITTNSFKVTEIASMVATNTYNYLDEYTSRGVGVPIGAFTGIKLISGFGKTVQMKLLSVSSVKCKIISSFTDAGINQTRHTISIDVISTVSLVTKSENKIASDTISILVYDNLIVGKVPEVYLNSQVIGNANKN